MINIILHCLIILDYLSNLAIIEHILQITYNINNPNMNEI